MVRTNSCAAPYWLRFSDVPSASITRHWAPSLTAVAATAASAVGSEPYMNVHAQTFVAAERISLTSDKENCGSGLMPSAALTYNVRAPTLAASSASLRTVLCGGDFPDPQGLPSENRWNQWSRGERRAG